MESAHVIVFCPYHAFNPAADILARYPLYIKLLTTLWPGGHSMSLQIQSCHDAGCWILDGVSTDTTQSWVNMEPNQNSDASEGITIAMSACQGRLLVRLQMVFVDADPVLWHHSIAEISVECSKSAATTGW